MATKVSHPESLLVSFRNVSYGFVPLKAPEDTWGCHVISATGIEVTLEESLEGLELVQTSLHETFHSIVHAYMPAGTTQNPKPGEETEEAYVDAIANGLVQVLRDNPDYLAFINYEIKESLK